MGNTESKDGIKKNYGHDQQIVQIIMNQDQIMQGHDNNQILLLIILVETTCIAFYLIYKSIRRRGEKAAIKKGTIDRPTGSTINKPA